MFAPVDPTIKEKVIELYLTGKGRNQIRRELDGQRVKVSAGSITNLINRYNKSLEQNAMEHEQSLRLNAGLNNVTSSTTTSDSKQTVIPRDGNPLSHFLSESPESPTVANQMNNSCNSLHQTGPANPVLEEDIDFSDTPANPELFYYPEISGDPLGAPNQQISGPRRLQISDDSDYDYVITEREFKQGSSLQDTDDTSIDLGVDFDSPEVFERRLMREIFNDKKERARHQELMELKTQRLEQIKSDIVKQNDELKDRQAKLKEIEPLLPSVRELQNAGITFNILFPYISLCHVKAVEQNVDLKTAAYTVSQIVRGVRDIDALNAAAEVAKNQISAIDTLATGKQAALTTIMNLQLKGFSDKDIEELVLLMQSWNKR